MALRAGARRHLPELSVLALRYFNPVGAHPGGLLGDVPWECPTT
ncbi:hypothetical protein ABZS88_14120 [Streptomyces sp. NPDC005480]